MTKLSTLLLALAIALPALHAQDVQAQDARQVAARVQAFYDQTSTVRTAFTQSHYDRVYQRTTRSRGVLTIARPGRLRFDYLGGDGKVIVSDGREITVYEPGDDGGPGQYARTPVREETIGAALGLLTGTARIDRDFAFRLRDASAFRWNGHVLELRPRRPEPSYSRILLFVDARPEAAGVVHRIVIQDHAGNLNRFDFQRSRFDTAVAGSTFELALPRGARRI
ncbi:MAG: outer membrane lipoprotein carrier protein LolA [Sandaracinaceae bacterium]|nr:outer membrane lipoprotein carrier protein LolA [Sandaracinaceae bacterium]